LKKPKKNLPKESLYDELEQAKKEVKDLWARLTPMLNKVQDLEGQWGKVVNAKYIGKNYDFTNCNSSASWLLYYKVLALDVDDKVLAICCEKTEIGTIIIRQEKIPVNLIKSAKEISDEEFGEHFEELMNKLLNGIYLTKVKHKCHNTKGK
jgi:hypothetical protein